MMKRVGRGRIKCTKSVKSVLTVIKADLNRLGDIHKGRPADPPEGGSGKSGQNRTWGEGGGGLHGIRTSGNEKKYIGVIVCIVYIAFHYSKCGSHGNCFNGKKHVL